MSGKIKQISITSLIILIILIVFSYLQFDDYKNNLSKFTSMEQSIELQEENYIKTIFKEEEKLVKKSMNIHIFNIQRKLKDVYGEDLDGLEEDIENPKADSKLSKVFDETLDGFYINENTKDNKQFVLSNKNLLWGRCFSFDSKYSFFTIENVLEFHHNDLNKQAIKEILSTTDTELVFWSSTNSNKIKEMDIENLIELYRNDGMNAMKDYELLVPTYITANGDIFGTKDEDSLGHKVNNYKMIVVQRVNIYDILKQYSSELSSYESEYEKMEVEIQNNDSNKIRGILVSIAMIIIVIFISAYLQNRKYN